MQVMIETKNEEGLKALIGQEVSIWCMNYTYAGKLIGVNDTCVKLEGAKIVYETGSFIDSGWKDAQSLPWSTHYIQCSAIESFGGVK